MPRLSAAFRLKKASYKVQPPDAENGMSGGVGGLRCAIAVTRPDSLRGTLLHVAEDVFKNNDRVVNQPGKGQRQPGKNHDID